MPSSNLTDRLSLRLFFLIRQQLDDLGRDQRDMVPALSKHVVIARHADRCIFEVRKCRLQCQDPRDRRVFEIAEDLADGCS